MSWRLVVYKYVQIKDENGKLKTVARVFVDTHMPEKDCEEAINSAIKFLGNKYAGYMMKRKV